MITNFYTIAHNLNTHQYELILNTFDNNSNPPSLTCIAQQALSLNPQTAAQLARQIANATCPYIPGTKVISVVRLPNQAGYSPCKLSSPQGTVKIYPTVYPTFALATQTATHFKANKGYYSLLGTNVFAPVIPVVLPTTNVPKI